MSIFRGWLRRLYASAQTLDRMDLSLFSWIPSRFKRRWMHRLFSRLDAVTSTGGPIEMDGLRYHLPDSMRGTFVLQHHEPGVRRLLAAELRPGMRVVDVGANIGYHALYAARLVGPEGRVWAVEPAEENLEYLRANVRDNGFTQIEVLPVAAGARRESRRLQLRADAGHHGFHAHPVEATVSEVEVDVVPLDEVIPEPVDLVKIDVEAGEVEALAGMEKLLDQSPNPRLLVEWNPPLLVAAGRDPSEILEWLAQRGFGLEVVTADGRRHPFDPDHLDAGTEHEIWATR